MAARRLRKPWAKLDFDWFEDSQVMLLESRSARDALDYAKLIAIWADFEGARIDLKDEGHLLKLRAKLKKGEKALRGLCDRLAALGLIDPDLWRELSVVTSRRAADDAGKRQRQRDGGQRGGEASTREAQAS